jgi:hypothetical protein
MNLEEKKAKYIALCHAMQTGVAFKMEKDNKDTSPKHLRVGINIAMSDHSALVHILFEKGILTEEEYFDALIESVEREVQMYESVIKELYGADRDIKITLR